MSEWNEPITIDAPRRDLALDAAGEIDGLLALIAQIAPQYEGTMRGLALRSKQLNEAILSILWGEEETAELYHEVHGVPMPAAVEEVEEETA